ncbi:MAG: AraC family transcriptional regulator [Lachnospiraceae bacterium]|nr:AraC family transcriptional regulator [Lachnospiraceae bacterium]
MSLSTDEISFNKETNDRISKVHKTIDDYVIASQADYHNTIDFEQNMLQYIETGDIESLNKYFEFHSAGNVGNVASSYLRQVKNIFITTATLVSRAAIRGGLPTDEALSLSDQYIQHAENYNNAEQIMNLQYHMVLDYASLVAKIRQGARHNKFIRTVISYIREHLTDELNVETMAQDLYVNRSYLSTKFKKETGTTLSAYIQNQKIDKSKELLLMTDRSILEIATYLGFSSQGYFQNVFKKQTGLTPKEFREK